MYNIIKLRHGMVTIIARVLVMSDNISTINVIYMRISFRSNKYNDPLSETVYLCRDAGGLVLISNNYWRQV